MLVPIVGVIVMIIIGIVLLFDGPILNKIIGVIFLVSGINVPYTKVMGISLPEHMIMGYHWCKDTYSVTIDVADNVKDTFIDLKTKFTKVIEDSVDESIENKK